MDFIPRWLCTALPGPITFGWAAALGEMVTAFGACPLGVTVQLL